MPRPQKFDDVQIVAAATQVAAQFGPHQTSIARIARHLKAPTGSIYHRFSSRSQLLGKAWLMAADNFQQHFAAVLINSQGDTIARGLAAALCIPQWVRTHPIQARLLLLHRIDDFLLEDWPREMKQQAKQLNAQLTQGMRQFSRDIFGNAKVNSVRIVTFALADAPLAALKKHIEKNEDPPIIVDQLIAQTYQQALKLGMNKL